VRIRIFILLLFTILSVKPLITEAQEHRAVQVNFYGQEIQLDFSGWPVEELSQPFSAEAVVRFNENLSEGNYRPVVDSLLAFRERHKLDDWLYYQLIRRAAEQISPKAENYNRYTLYKWFLLTRSGYDAVLATSGNRMLFYVQSGDNIYNIPYREKNGRQYICLNYHDYGSIDFEKNPFTEVPVSVQGAYKAFSYRITHLPEFRQGDYQEKDIHFTYNEQEYHFRIKLNPQVKTIFTNYPSSDYAAHFNMPLSKETYGSLIPALKKHIKGLSTRHGVDFLMHFTRYAFLFKPDTEIFGQEKRLSPEQTLLYEYSDCEDRAALFFFLVKEIYNLPMIVVLYPQHVTIGVQFDKPYGQTIVYKGNKYSFCEPSPQKKDLRIGQTLPELSKTSYEIAYVYEPEKK
jgi:hypothetical protein